jgi:plasmid stability protein
MPELLIPDVDEAVLNRLQERATAHGRSPQDEAKAILMEATSPRRTEAWQEVNAIRQRLAASGRTFSDSTELIREDRRR